MTTSKIRCIFLIFFQGIFFFPVFEAVAQRLPAPRVYDQLSPGSLAPDVVKVDADYISDVVEGTCIIRKGKLHALIDLKGNFIVPWGKYEFNYLSQTNAPRFKKLLLVKDPVALRFGYINLKGQVVIPVNYITPGTFDVHGIARMGTISEFSYYINEKNVKVVQNLEKSHVNEMYERARLGERQSELLRYEKGGLFGYVDMQGKVMIPAKYRAAGQFTEGLAPVLMADEFGVYKWGYIDTTGKLVIPYRFQIQPGNFHEGLALIAPLNVEEAKYNFAYIDKTGKIAVKVGEGNRFSRLAALKENDGHGPNISNGSFFIGDHAFWNVENSEYVIDKTGKKVGLYDFIKNPEVYNIPKELYFIKYDDKGIKFRTTNANFKENIFGIMDFDGTVLFPPNFSSLKPDYFSPYAMASTVSNTGPNRSAIIRQGIINPQGVFVMILETPALF